MLRGGEDLDTIFNFCLKHKDTETPGRKGNKILKKLCVFVPPCFKTHFGESKNRFITVPLFLINLSIEN